MTGGISPTEQRSEFWFLRHSKHCTTQALLLLKVIQKCGFFSAELSTQVYSNNS